MGAVCMGNPNGEAIESVAQMLGKFIGELYPKMTQWKERLSESPDSLVEIEQEAHDLFLRGAGMIVAGVVAVVLASEQFAAKTEATRKDYGTPLGKGRNRTLRIQMVGGFLMWVTSLYCEPKSKLIRRKETKAPGVHVELVQFGFGKRISPQVQSMVSRQSALCPSFEMATHELSRMGIKHNIKAVRRIAQQCGDGMLRLRTHRVRQWREGKLAQESSMKGKRISVQIDGGRTRLRGALRKVEKTQDNPDNSEPSPQDNLARSKRRRKSSFNPQWREPKLCTIFVHDENGRMVKDTKATLDGTFEGPDAIAELIAMHLHRLGAAEAESITFIADGAPWIWDRIDKITVLAKIPSTVKIHQVLDCCHAVHHIAVALKCLGQDESERMPMYRDMRTRLRNGEWRGVVDDLTDLAESSDWPSTTATEIEYLRKHGEAGRLSFPYYRRLGLPLGSGAIESSIRRVINNRLKGNGIFWRQSNAESMLQLRCQVLSDYWDDTLRAMQAMQQTVSVPDWHWTPQAMSLRSEAETQTSEKPTILQGKT